MLAGLNELDELESGQLGFQLMHLQPVHVEIIHSGGAESTQLTGERFLLAMDGSDVHVEPSFCSRSFPAFWDLALEGKLLLVTVLFVLSHKVGLYKLLTAHVTFKLLLIRVMTVEMAV